MVRMTAEKNGIACSHVFYLHCLHLLYSYELQKEHLANSKFFLYLESNKNSKTCFSTKEENPKSAEKRVII